jgi:hypothetical protein
MIASGIERTGLIFATENKGPATRSTDSIFGMVIKGSVMALIL